MTITFKPELKVTTGCFEYKTLKELEKAVLDTHGHSDLGKEYLATMEYIKAIDKFRK